MVKAVGLGRRAWFNGCEGMIVVDVIYDGEFVGVIVVVGTFNRMRKDAWVDVHDRDGGCILINIVLGLD